MIERGSIWLPYHKHPELSLLPQVWASKFVELEGTQIGASYDCIFSGCNVTVQRTHRMFSPWIRLDAGPAASSCAASSQA